LILYLLGDNMTIALVSPGIFTMWGQYGGMSNDLVAVAGGASTTNVASATGAPTRQTQFEIAAAAVSPPVYLAVDGIVTGFIPDVQSTVAGNLTGLQAIAQQAIVTIANNDVPLAQQTPQAALTLLAQQMTAASATIKASVPALGALTALTGVTPVGNPVFVTSTKLGVGLVAQQVYPELLNILITSDSVTGGATAGQEPYSITGYPQAASSLAWNWLTTGFGSGIAITGNLINGAAGNQGGFANDTVNGDFTAYSTANYPDCWVKSVGTIGTTILNGTVSNAYTTGGGSLQFAGNGSELTAVYQPFNTAPSTIAGAGGTAYNIAALPDTPFAVNLWLKVDVQPASGVVEIALTDGTGTIINDDQSVANSKTQSLTGLTGGVWQNVNAVFRLPKSPPTNGIWLRIRLSTFLSNGKNVYFGRVGFAQMQQLYTGGPFVAAFSGNTNVNATGLTPDAWTINVTNTLGAFAKLLWQWFSPATMTPPVYIPTASSPSISDTLVS
jgi:hypothetical protein